MAVPRDMPTGSSSPERALRSEDRRSSALAFSVSVAVHVGIIVAGFFIGWIVTQPDPVRPEPIASFFDPALGVPAAASLASEPPTAEPPAASAAPAALSPATLEPPAALSVVMDEPLLLTPSIEPSLPMPSPSVSTTALALERRFPDVRLLGARSSNAESIVYVVDATGSMLTTMPIVKRELAASIERLTPVQRFQVMFFQNESALAAPHPDLDQSDRALQLMRATTANKREVGAWIDGISANGRSTPIHALRMALALQPDVIFLLSSGDNITREGGDAERETRAILAELDALNPVDARTDRRRVPIKVLHFLSPDASGLLQAIAAAHGGRDGYKYISREDLGLQ